MVENEANPTNEEAKKKKKKLFIVLGSILGIGAIVGASVGIYFAVKPNNNQVDVVFEKEVIGVTLETSRATIGKDYDTKILVDTSKTSGKVLKDTLDEVKSDNEILTKDNSYTYGIDNTKTIGTLHIPAEYVKGKIVIKVTLASKTATLTIRDDGSQQYGKLSHGVQIDYTIDISDCIGKDNFTINFVPEGAYENADFQIVSSNSVFTPTYNTNKAIKFVGTSELKDGDDLVITLNDKWYEDQTYINNLNDADVLEEHPDGSIGEVKALIVNGLRHKVRLIGVDKDCTDVAKPEDTKIHTTWEFVNLISDSNGYSLAAQWNDTNNIGTVNHEYTESTIHYALNGENVNNVLWAQKEATTWSSDYKCSVLDMLNEGNPGFVDVIKAPSKYINIYNDQKLPDPGFEEQTVEDKLFLLSPFEMGTERSQYEEKKTTTYPYYDKAENAKRIKKQINGTEEYAPAFDSAPTIPNGKGQIYKDDVYNYAGYNSKADATGGGLSWLRSPNIGSSNHCVWYIYPNGSRNSGGVPHYCAASVAPAFCIQ